MQLPWALWWGSVRKRHMHMWYRVSGRGLWTMRWRTLRTWLQRCVGFFFNHFQLSAFVNELFSWMQKCGVEFCMFFTYLCLLGFSVFIQLSKSKKITKINNPYRCECMCTCLCLLSCYYFSLIFLNTLAAKRTEQIILAIKSWVCLKVSQVYSEMHSCSQMYLRFHYYIFYIYDSILWIIPSQSMGLKTLHMQRCSVECQK